MPEYPRLENVEPYTGSEEEAVLNDPGSYDINDRRAAKTLIEKSRANQWALYDAKWLHVKGSDLQSALSTWMTGAMLESLALSPSAQVDESLLRTYKSKRPELSPCVSWLIRHVQERKKDTAPDVPNELTQLTDFWHAYDRATEALGCYESREDVMGSVYDLRPDTLEASGPAYQRFVAAIKKNMKRESDEKSSAQPDTRSAVTTGSTTCA